MTHQTVSPVTFHLRQAIKAMEHELETVPPHSIEKETRTAEKCQLIDMLRRRERPAR